MPYWKCYYHIIWATKHREPSIIPAYEAVIYAAIEQKAAELRSQILAINGVTDHIHVAANFPPSMSISKFVGAVKGASSRAINTSFERDNRFAWQAGYGVMTFGEKALPFVLQYIADQKTHHQNGTVNTYLEYSED